MTIKFNDLPIELLDLIFKKMCVHELFVLKFVCKKWFFLIKDLKIYKHSKKCYYYRRHNNYKLNCYVYNGYLDVLKWNKENGFSKSYNLCSAAAKNGHLDVLKWLRKNNYEWEYTCNHAAENGHLDVLQWAIDNGATWNSDTCKYAAMNGHLDVLKWAKINGCQWNVDTCNYAAMRGHFNVLRWAIRNGCEWSGDTYKYAVTRSHLDGINKIEVNIIFGVPFSKNPL